MKFSKLNLLHCFVTLKLACIAGVAWAVPPGFLLQPAGNQRDVHWKRLETQKFVVYYDEKALHFAKTGLAAVEAAYPDFSLLLGVKLDDKSEPPALFPANYLKSSFEKIPIVVSSRSWGASFANFATQNLEIQSATGSNAALFQHELTHRMMYEHIDPNFGPAGRPVMLAMIPTWWIEGLPEYLTESMGRLETLGIVRTMALKNRWLTYDRLNALYNASGDTNSRGYVISGRLFNYVVNHMKEGDLSDLHKDLFFNLVTPPFLTGVNATLKKYLNKSGGDVYEDFKSHELNLWQNKLTNMPSIYEKNKQKILLNSSYPSDVVVTSNGVYTSNLASPPAQSTLLYVDLKGEAVRLPLNIRGNDRFDFHPAETKNGGFWTAHSKKYSNGTASHDVQYVPFKGELKNISDDNLLPSQVFAISSEANPLIVSQIMALGRGRAMVLANARGKTHLIALDVQSEKETVIKKWENPNQIKMLNFYRSESKVEARNCVTLLVDEDQEKTSLEKVCTDGTSSNLLNAGKIFIKDGVELANGQYQLLGAWSDLLGIFTFDGKQITPEFALPEWVDGLKFWGSEGALASWVYEVGRYDLVKFNVKRQKENFAAWAQQDGKNNSYKKWPGFENYYPPYARYAAAKRRKLASLEKKSTAQQYGPTPVQSLEQQNVKYTNEEAHYRNGHLFSYPTVVPPVFGGWSLGLASVPFMDEMERHRIEVFGAYNFLTRSLSGSATYVNNRVFDDLRFSVFSNERFNGLIYIVRNLTDSSESQYRYSVDGTSRDSYTFSYLRENGFKVSSQFRFRPSSFVLDVHTQMSQIRPSSVPVGAQNASLLNIGGQLSWSLFETNFYTADANKISGEYINWSTRPNLGAEQTVSLGKVTDGRLQQLPALNFQRATSSISSSMSFRGHSLTYRGTLSTRLGVNALNAKETYSPYTTYLFGSGQGLNNLSYPLYASNGGNRLFRYMQGYWAYRNSMSYDFPVWSNLDTQFLIAYIDSIQGEVVVGRGGVAKDKNFKKLESVNSASCSARLNIDIKGLQIWPSLAYGRILGEPGWTLFSELSFSQLF